MEEETTTKAGTTASAAAGSAAQLPRVEAELRGTGSNVTPTVSEAKSKPPEPVKHEPKPSTSANNRQPKVNATPFNVRLVRLTPEQIERHTRPGTTVQPATTPGVKPVNICLCRLPLTANQSATLAQPPLKNPTVLTTVPKRAPSVK